VRERPKGAVARATAVAEGVAGAMRRRQRERGPRVVLYTGPGEPRLLAPGAKGHDHLIDLGERLVALAKSANSGD
jgi:hypothetical protein